MYPRRLISLLLVLGVLVSGLQAPPVGAATVERCFAESNYCIQGRFLAYWEANGGLDRNGFPVSAERQETLEDGNTYTVQYFERLRLEYHPENPPPYDVLLGQFGRRMLSAAYGEYANYQGYQQAIAPTTPLAGATFFPATGHNLSGRFLAYWEANGGLAQFGYPITEERYDGLTTTSGGSCCVTQYFERARFEYHPEYAGTPYEVLLGQFGRQILADNDQMAGEFRHQYFTEARVRERLGAPRGPQLSLPGAVQPFERGLMVWRGDFRRIFVLLGTADAGQVAFPLHPYGPGSRDPEWEDIWTTDQEPGGGAAPLPNHYYPQRGFGKLWREQGFLEELGYATTPNEQGFTMTLQQFAAGYLLTTEGPDGHSTYAIFLQAAGSHNVSRIGSYERIAGR